MSSPGEPDARTIELDAGPQLTVQLCAAANLRPLRSCAPIAGLTVTVAETGAHAATDVNGRAEFPVATGAVTLVATDGGGTYFGTAVMAEGAVTVQLPVLTRAVIEALSAANVGGRIVGRGLLVVHTSPNATLTSAGESIPFYDVGDSTQLTTQPPTNATGTAVFFNLIGPVETVLSSPQRPAQTVSATVRADAVTFIAAPL